MENLPQIFSVQWFSLAGIVIACFLFLFFQMQRMESRLESRMDQQAARSDRLYEMFIDLLKEQRRP